MRRFVLIQYLELKGKFVLCGSSCSENIQVLNKGSFALLKSLKGYFKKCFTRKSAAQVTITLDEEASKRLKKIGLKIPTLNDKELIDLALTCLEQKSNGIIRRTVKRKIQALRKENYDFNQIVDYLNSNKIPTISSKVKWESGDVFEMVERQGVVDEFMARPKK